MAFFILEDATGIGSNDIDTLQAFVDLVIIANDDGVGMDDPVGGKQLVTYNRTESGPPQLRLDDLVNTTFTPDYGSGPQQVDIVVIPGLSGFTLDDGTSFQNNGTSLPPNSSGLPGSTLNTTEFNLVIYDTQQNICVARDGTGGDIDLPESNPVVLYHELSHSFRIVTNAVLALTAECDPSSPEENAAIVDENDLRTQIANRQGETPELRDPGNHCGTVGCDGGCCIIATAASRSLNSKQIHFLRSVRDHFVRSTEVGYAFFQKFFYDYYSFSPQVCTIMAGNSAMPGHLLEGYINPLLDFWRIMIERSGNNFTDAELGAMFVRHHGDRDAARARLEALQRTVAYWLQDESATDAPPELLKLLRERAWPSEYMQWALIAPVRIYHEMLTLYLAGADEITLGRAFNEELDAWAPELPISDVWAALAADEVVKELEFCENVLLQSATSKKRFHQRLLDRFKDITAIDVILNGLAVNTGVVQ
jgi:hypothetical protein